MKKILYKLLPLKSYLKLLHVSYRFLYSTKILKNDPSYKFHYFDKNIIQEGWTVLDIGANMGYFTVLFSEWVGNKGMVYAVEPVIHFFEILSWATRKRSNVKLFNYALGEEEKEITMVTPGNFGYLRTGLPHVSSEADLQESHEFTFKAKMTRASQLFGKIPKIDFIKCDIEGYEDIVLPEMKNVLVKFKPIIQLETWGEHQARIEPFLEGLGYDIYTVENDKVIPISNKKSDVFSDLLFIHKDNNKILELLKSKNLA